MNVDKCLKFMNHEDALAVTIHNFIATGEFPDHYTSSTVFFPSLPSTHEYTVFVLPLVFLAHFLFVSIMFDNIQSCEREKIVRANLF